MKRAIWLQETRAMRFLQTYEDRNAGRLSQHEAAQILGICERSFRRYLSKYDEGGLDALSAPQAANRYLKEVYQPTFNKHFAVSAAEPGMAYVALRGFDVDEVLSERYERTVGNDNCVSYENLRLQTARRQAPPSLRANQGAGAHQLLGADQH